MKNVTLVVHAEIEQALADLLRALPAISGFTFTHVEGHGTQDENDPALSARDRVVGYTPHVRVDIVVADEDVDPLLNALRESRAGLAGRSVYWITPVEYGRL